MSQKFWYNSIGTSLYNKPLKQKFFLAMCVSLFSIPVMLKFPWIRIFWLLRWEYAIAISWILFNDFLCWKNWNRDLTLCFLSLHLDPVIHQNQFGYSASLGEPFHYRLILCSKKMNKSWITLSLFFVAMNLQRVLSSSVVRITVLPLFGLMKYKRVSV
jgi:hypothetical protein